MTRWLKDNPTKSTLQRRKWDKTEKGIAYRKKHKEYMREYRKRKGNHVRSLQRKYYRELRYEIISHYGGNPPKCKCCGESIFEFLTLDHIKGGGNQHRKSLKVGGNGLYAWIKRNNFPPMFQILCANCNYAKWTSKECPHKTIYAEHDEN